MSGDREKLTTSQIAGIVAVSAVALGIQVVRHLNRSPAQKAADAEALRRSNARRREYDRRKREAYALDRQRWSAFNHDEQATAAFNADYFIPVSSPPAAAAKVERTAGGSMWDTWGTYVVTTDESRLTLTFGHDGKYLLVMLASPAGEYEFSGSYAADKLVIGKCDGTPTDPQREVAGMIRAIPPQREFIGQEPFVVFEDYWKLRYEHYARYAAARGWPPEKDGEAKRVEEDYRNSRT